MTTITVRGEASVPGRPDGVALSLEPAATRAELEIGVARGRLDSNAAVVLISTPESR